MRSLRFLLPLLTAAGVLMAPAQEAHKTEAQQDGLSGPVRSVSMHAEQSQLQLVGSETWAIQNVPSGVIEYDRDGNRIKDGQPLGLNGEFQGQTMQFVRDGNGRVIERTVSVMPSAEMIEHDAYGPFGLVRSVNSSNGKPTVLHTIGYDAHGNVLQDESLDGDEKPIFRTLYRRREDGKWTERTLWIKGVRHSYENYDPDSDFQRYEEYDQSGAVVVAFTHHNGRIESYWAGWEDPNWSTSIVSKLDNGDTRTSSCHRGGTCNDSILHAVYLDKARHNPAMTEIRSGDGNVLCRASYEYQMDDHENWTSRKIWLQKGAQGERALYETDSRTITYWSE
jgi:YD repeat-containing protein